ncbi:MAG: hypothetical protein U5L74_11245 [Ideonella sp.]|nr:hypothetical protein [Ideonella sp.]
MDAHIRAAVEDIYGYLARGEYDALARKTGGVRLGAAEIERAVRDYRFTIAAWPHAGDLPIDVVEVNDASPRAWSVQATAYTLEEGRSDLTLEMTLVEIEAGQVSVELDNLHVL